jgi:ATPase subunit of ABC transporter with duplicated ATPase domains
VLDEPTNHLDLATKEMLIQALSQYEGTMLFVSHDRHFLAALSNRVLELTPEGIHVWRRLHRICRAHGLRGTRPPKLTARRAGIIAYSPWVRHRH